MRQASKETAILKKNEIGRGRIKNIAIIKILLMKISHWLFS